MPLSRRLALGSRSFAVASPFVKTMGRVSMQSLAARRHWLARINSRGWILAILFAQLCIALSWSSLSS